MVFANCFVLFDFINALTLMVGWLGGIWPTKPAAAILVGYQGADLQSFPNSFLVHT